MAAHHRPRSLHHVFSGSAHTHARPHPRHRTPLRLAAFPSTHALSDRLALLLQDPTAHSRRLVDLSRMVVLASHWSLHALRYQV